jgi:hypothetical protein
MPEVDSWWLLLAGVVALVAAMLWHHAVRSRRMAELRNGLWFGDAAERARAGEGFVDLGLAPAARVILPWMEVERDPGVRAAVALAVARRQWEPGGSKPVLAIRTWARDELQAKGHDVVVFGPAFARASDMGGPRREPPGGPAAASGVQP